MLTDKDLEELRQERHNDYVAEARREHIEAGLARAAGLRQMDAKARKVEFTFITSLLGAQCAIEALDQHRAKLWARQKWANSQLTDAMSLGMYALEDKAESLARSVRDFGQLLFAFEGTTVLQGGAA